MDEVAADQVYDPMKYRFKLTSESYEHNHLTSQMSEVCAARLLCARAYGILFLWLYTF
jgi:hypothetical protein